MKCNSALFTVCLSISLHLTAAQARSVTPLVEVGQSTEMTVFKEVSITGTVTSPQKANLSPEVSGRVKSLLIDEGVRVKKGDLILKLDQELEKLKLDVAIAQTRQAQLELADAKRRLVDAKRLEEKKSISENDVRTLQTEVDIGAAVLQRTEAQQQQQEARLRRHQLKAPFDGVVSQKHTEAGEWISPGDAVVEIVATDNLRIDFQAPQTIYPEIKPSNQIRISLDAMPDKTFNGKIIAIVPVTVPEARTFKIRVTIDAEELVMTPGMSANGVLQLDTGGKAIVVSRDALVRHPDGRTTVWIVNHEKAVTERLVKTGLSFNGNVVIEKGLEANVTLVVKGNESLKEGQQISIQQD